jgi:DNA polymerase I-like protein with 3'-5' exonuclease and polymerase domains
MKYKILTANALARELVKYLITLPSVAVDSETSGLEWITGKMYWLQFSDGKQAWLVDIRQIDVQIFKKFFESEKVIKIIHNSAFDAAWLCREFGIYTHNIWDTRYQEQIILGVALGRGLTKAEKEIYEERFSSSLKFCLKRRDLPDKFEFEEFLPLPHMPGKQQQLYMVRDVEFLHELMADQKETIDRLGLGDVSYLENVIAEITYQMMCNGFGVLEKEWLAYTESEEVIYNQCMEQLNAIAPINWNSWQQYCKFFGVARTEGLDNITGVNSFYTGVNDLTVKPPVANHKEAQLKWKALQLFREARNHYKAVTTYGRSWLAQHVHDGLVRCQYTQMVNTARYSCDSPNMQNLLPEVTKFLVPGHGKSNVFVIADFSGQEMAIMAYASQEPRWLECLRAGRDLHGMVAGDVLGDVWDNYSADEKKAQRKIIKIINFSIAYGAGVETIAERAGTDSSTISVRLGKMKRLYPALFRYLERNGNEAKASFTSYSLPPFNRFRSLEMETEGWRRVNIGKNNPIQMTAADMAKLAMYYMYKEIQAGFPALFIHMLHDELIIECKKSDSERTAMLLAKCMNSACIAILGEALSAPEVKIQYSWDKLKKAG